MSGMAIRLKCCQLRWIGRSVWLTGDRYWSQFTTLTVDICVQQSGREALLHTGLSVAAETCSGRNLAIVPITLVTGFYNLSLKHRQCKLN